MLAASDTDWQCPSVKIFNIRDGRIPPDPEIIFTREPERVAEADWHRQLFIVAVHARMEADLESACAVAATSSQGAISVAVIEGAAGRQALDRLHGQFDAVLLAGSGCVKDVIARLARAIVRPGGIGQHIGFDWNEMRTIVRGEHRPRTVRFGFARASGPHRADQASSAGRAKAEGAGT